MAFWKVVGISGLVAVLSGCSSSSDEAAIEQDAISTSSSSFLPVTTTGEDATSTSSSSFLPITTTSDGSTAAHDVSVTSSTTTRAVTTTSSSSITTTTVDRSNVFDLLPSTFLQAIVAADLEERARSPGPFTVFAPVDGAFDMLPADTVDFFMKPENKVDLVDILMYHVLDEQVLLSDLDGSGDWLSDQGQPVFGGQRAMTTLQGEDLVLWVHPKYDDVYANLAFSGAMVVKKDNLASNGVVHTIDRVLSPPSKNYNWNVLGVLKSKDYLSTFVQAIMASDLDAHFGGRTPMTIFVPTNDACDRFAEEHNIDLWAPENKGKLADIMKYHIVPASWELTSNIGELRSLHTLDGSDVLVQNVNGQTIVFFGDFNNGKFWKSAVVEEPDIIAPDGVVHVVNQVLLPKWCRSADAPCV